MLDVSRPSRNKSPRIALYMTQAEWRLVADCVLDSAAGPTVAHALASRVLRPIHDKLIEASTRVIKPTVLAGAAKIAVERKNTPQSNGQSQAFSWSPTVVHQVMQLLVSDSSLAGKRKAAEHGAKLTGCELSVAKQEIMKILEQMEN